ncbi:hypothetical protein H4582DRAFT_4437 [Lactarius indigo]|nr:hypothetical protein H4582DRAFT_4437 [Lactarius indigo]
MTSPYKYLVHVVLRGLCLPPTIFGDDTGLVLPRPFHGVSNCRNNESGNRRLSDNLLRIRGSVDAMVSLGETISRAPGGSPNSSRRVVAHWQPTVSGHDVNTTMTIYDLGYNHAHLIAVVLVARAGPILNDTKPSTLNFPQ